MASSALFSRGRGTQSPLLAWAERRLNLTPNGVVLVGVAVAGWILARLLGNRALIFAVYGLLLVLGIAYLSARRSLVVEAERSQLPLRLRQGQLIDVALRITSRRPVSTVVFEEVLPPSMGDIVRVPVPALKPGSPVEHAYAFNPALRGAYTIGPLTAVWSDPFGLTRRRRVVLEAVEILVHPSVESVQDRVTSREWEDPPVRPPFSKPWPTGFEFYGMRDYQPGDDPRRIVWRAAARTWDPDSNSGTLLVRESEQGITDRVTLIIDGDAAHHDDGDPSPSFETAVSAAASVAVQHLRDGFAVTIESNDRRLVDAARGTTAEIGMLDELARLERNHAPLADAVERLLVEGGRPRHIVLITPRVDERAAARLRLFIDYGASLIVCALVGDDRNPPWIHRVATLGGQVAELQSGAPLATAFSYSAGTGVRRR